MSDKTAIEKWNGLTPRDRRRLLADGFIFDSHHGYSTREEFNEIITRLSAEPIGEAVPRVCGNCCLYAEYVQLRNGIYGVKAVCEETTIATDRGDTCPNWQPIGAERSGDE